MMRLPYEGRCLPHEGSGCHMKEETYDMKEELYCMKEASHDCDVEGSIMVVAEAHPTMCAWIWAER